LNLFEIVCVFDHLISNFVQDLNVEVHIEFSFEAFLLQKLKLVLDINDDRVVNIEIVTGLDRGDVLGEVVVITIFLLILLVDLALTLFLLFLT
jgi:hypothetical protein